MAEINKTKRERKGDNGERRKLAKGKKHGLKGVFASVFWGSAWLKLDLSWNKEDIMANVNVHVQTN